MKKGILFTMFLLLGGVVFAQGYTYEDAEYGKVAEQINSLTQVERFPKSFYFDTEKRGDVDTYNDRRNLFYLAKETYEKNPQSFNATYNYGAALLSEIRVDEFFFLPQNNAYEAREVLKKAISLNPKSVETYRLLDLAYEYIIFAERRSNDCMAGSRFYDHYDEESTRAYSGKQARAAERLNVLERRIALQDEFLTSVDYHEAGLLSEALGLHSEADMYYEMERNAGCENED